MTTLTIASLFPDLLNIHGDAENAAVLAVRAGWRGLDAAVVTLAADDHETALLPDLVTIGAGFDADAPEVLAGLEAMREALTGWVAAGVPVLAVGLGWDLLSSSVELSPGVVTPGIGIFSGRSVASPRTVGTVAVESSAWGTATGYEYHLRDYILGPDEVPLGRVIGGVGNLCAGRRGRPTGRRAVRGNAFGTGIRGPVLARNPAIADHLLHLALARRSWTASGSVSPSQASADAYAERANAIVLANIRSAR